MGSLEATALVTYDRSRRNTELGPERTSVTPCGTDHRMDVLISEATVERLVSPGHQLTPEARALAYFRFFDEYPRNGGELELAEAVRFYNRYYWFTLFAARRQAATGFDAGIEQQRFQILEGAPDDVDWAVVTDLEKRIVLE